MLCGLIQVFSLKNFVQFIYNLKKEISHIIEDNNIILKTKEINELFLTGNLTMI